MSFGGSSNYPNEKPKPLGIDENKLSTNEQARPVPYFAGKRRVAVTFISEVFDIRKAAVTRDVGKQKTRTGTSYFFSFAALVAHGPVDGIHQIILNNEVVWSGEMLRVGTDYVDITIPDYGLIRLYWGTETQTRDDYLFYTAGGYNDTGPEHPPYRGFCYLVAHQLFAGFNQSNIQNLEVVVSRYPEFGTAIERIGDDANPVKVFIEMVTHPRLGRTIDSSLLDMDALNTLAAQIADEGIGVSPLVTTQVQALALIKTLLEYIDGYPSISTEGILSLGVVRPQLDLSGVPIVDESVMAEPLNIQPEDWSATFSEVNVKFTNPDQNFDEDSRSWRDRGNFAVSGLNNVQTIERPWITSPQVADFTATAVGRMRALPEATGEISLRRTALFDQLTPGALFKINYPPRGYTELLCRVVDRAVPDPARPIYNLAFRLDRSYLINGLGVAEAEPPNDEVAFEAASIANARVVELPVALSPDGKPTLAVLASRPEAITAGFKTYLGKNYDASGMITPDSFDVIDTHDRFCWRGLLMAAYPATQPSIDDNPGLQVNLTGPDTELDDLTMFDGLADELIVFIDDEVFSVAEAEVIGKDAYRLTVLRARFGTIAADHAEEAEVFIARRSELQALQHPLFQPKNTAILKIQAFTGQAQSVLEDETELDVVIGGRVYTEPPLANLTVNGNGSNPSYTTGQSIVIGWTATDGGELPHRSDLLSREVVVEFYNEAGDTLLGTTSTPGGSLSLTNAELQALLGGSEVTFLLEAKLKTVSDWWEVESDPISILVNKV